MRPTQSTLVCFLLVLSNAYAHASSTSQPVRHGFTKSSTHPDLHGSETMICAKVDSGGVPFADSTFLSTHESLADSSVIVVLERGYRAFVIAQGSTFEDAAAELAGCPTACGGNACIGRMIVD